MSISTPQQLILDYSRKPVTQRKKTSIEWLLVSMYEGKWHCWATSLSTWRPCDGARRTATSHLVIDLKADPAGVPGSCHYQRKVGIQPWTLFDAFERCCCTAAHGYSHRLVLCDMKNDSIHSPAVCCRFHSSFGDAKPAFAPRIV